MDDAINYFLEHAGIYAYLDSLFNYLRKPLKYKKECARVIKVYYAALISILNSMNEVLKNQGLPCTEMYHDLLEGKDNTDISPNNILSQIVDGFESAIVAGVENKTEEEKNNLYYYQIKKLAESGENEVSCITTNYTTIGERIVKNKNCPFVYLHGKLGLFEELETKKIANVDEVNLEKTVFPYLLVQSGVKPIISAYQIQEFNKACRMISEAEALLILGYGINPDDEHITNFLRERLRNGKSIKIFIYCNEKNDSGWNMSTNNIHEQLGNDGLIEFYHTNEFRGMIEKFLQNG